MTEWRRTLKSWPKETAKVADSASLPVWIVEAARTRRDAQGGRRAKKRMARLLWLLLPFYLLVVFLPTDDPLTWTLIGGLLLSVPLSVLATGRIIERAERRRRDELLEQLGAQGESTLGGDFVGVGYSDACWNYEGIGRHLDEGVLQLDLDRLTFVGRDTRFELPAEAILDTEIRRHEGGFGDRMRLYVRWADGGEAGTLSLELPYRRAAGPRVREIVDLRERIERWRNEPFPRRTAPSDLPLAVEPRKKVNPSSQVGRTAQLTAGLLVILGLLSLTVGGDLALHEAGFPQLGHKLGGSSGAFCGFGYILWFLLAAKIERRLPERLRYQPKEQDALRDALRDVEASTIAEPLNSAKIKQ